MTAITFPNSPSSGDTHTAGNGIVYTYDGEKWTSIGTNSAGTWTRSGTTVSLTNAGDDLNVDSGTFFVDASTNNVGVGTTSFTASASGRQILEINGTASALINLDAGGTRNAYIYSDASETYFYNTQSGPLIFGTSNTQQMRIESSGNLLIGLTSGAANGKLQVAGGIRVAGSASPSDTSSPYIYRTSGADNLCISTSSTERLRIDSAGRLLVGTTSSSSAATIVCQGSSSSATQGSQIFMQRGQAAASISSGDTLGRINFADNAGGVYALIEGETDGTGGSNDYPGRLVFSTTDDGASSPTERMRIGRKGATKMTTTNSYLNVSKSNIHEMRVSNVDDWTCYLTNIASSQPFGLSIRYPNSSPNSTTDDGIRFEDSSAIRFRVLSNGGISNFQSNNTNLCDEREKKNIVSLDTKWDKVKSWELKKFHYNEDADTDDLRYGVIAQQVEEHCPEVLADWQKQKAEDAVLDEDGNVVEPAKEEILRKAVKEQQMMWMAIKALQEAQERIETLETKVAQLEANN